MAKIESLPLNVVLQLVHNEMMLCSQSLIADVKSVGIAADFIDSTEENECPLLAIVDIENADDDKVCGEHPWLLVWDEDSCDFSTVMRLDQKETEFTKVNV